MLRRFVFAAAAAVAFVPALALADDAGKPPQKSEDAGAKTQPLSKLEVKQVPASPEEHPATDEVADFTEQAKLLFRVVACTGDMPLPANIDAKTVDAYCKLQLKQMEKYKKTWVEVAEPFIAGLRPKDLPDRVVYPFGGGDLISAITTYPDAKDYTTMSLEHPGDPRRIMKITQPQLEASLNLIRMTSNGLLVANDSKTESLMKGQRGEIPGQLSFFLIALAVHGYEPVSLKYFKMNEDGTLHYLTWKEIAAEESKNAKLLHQGWTSPDFSEAFSASELTFVRRGGDKSQIKVHHHLAENLDDTHFGKEVGLQKWLSAKAPFVAMTKAASYLLWRDDFSKIRNLLLDHMVYMVSDSTGIPPEFATKAGFVQDTYGKFQASFLGAKKEYNDEFRKLWKDNPQKDLKFRYGYIDGMGNFHMMVTRKADKAAPKG